jgi:hypothetical protein
LLGAEDSEGRGLASRSHLELLEGGSEGFVDSRKRRDHVEQVREVGLHKVDSTDQNRDNMGTAQLSSNRTCYWIPQP